MSLSTKLCQCCRKVWKSGVGGTICSPLVEIGLTPPHLWHPYQILGVFPHQNSNPCIINLLKVGLQIKQLRTQTYCLASIMILGNNFKTNDIIICVEKINVSCDNYFFSMGFVFLLSLIRYVVTCKGVNSVGKSGNQGGRAVVIWWAQGEQYWQLLKVLWSFLCINWNQILKPNNQNPK